MLYNFEEPKIIAVFFNIPSKKPLVIRNVKFIKTGKEIIFGYIARDNRIHRHRYSKHSVIEYKELTKEQYAEYKKQLSKIKRNTRSATYPAVSYKTSGVH